MAKKKNDSAELSQNLRRLPAEVEEKAMGEIAIYNPVDSIRIEVRLERETVWLTQSQLGVLFGVDRTVIVRHIGNIYRIGELEEESTCAKIAQVQNEGGRERCPGLEDTMKLIDQRLGKSVRGPVNHKVYAPR